MTAVPVVPSVQYNSTASTVGGAAVENPTDCYAMRIEECPLNYKGFYCSVLEVYAFESTIVVHIAPLYCGEVVLIL